MRLLNTLRLFHINSKPCKSDTGILILLATVLEAKSILAQTGINEFYRKSNQADRYYISLAEINLAIRAI